MPTQQKMYNLDILNQLKVEIDKFKQLHNNETTLDNILIQAKSHIIPLLKAGYNHKHVAIILKSIGINVGMQRIKKLYPLPNVKQKPTSILIKNDADTESNTNTSIDMYLSQQNEQEDTE